MVDKDKQPEAEKYKKIVFWLEKDEDDYPPAEKESLWALEVGRNRYKIDNIPFFVQDVSWGDVVRAYPEGEDLIFDKVIEPSGHSVLRVMVFDPKAVPEVRGELAQLRCSSELSHIEGLIAIDVPGEAPYDEITRFLSVGEDEGKWEYEEGSVRHEV